MPGRNANIRMPATQGSSRRSEPPARADEDTLSEDELFAIFVARLL